MRLAETDRQEQLDRGAYRHLSLVALAQCIVRESDSLALRELHDHRPAFRFGGGNTLRLAEFLGKLAETRMAWDWVGGQQLTLDRAYDHALAKFTNLPLGPKDASLVGVASPRQRNRSGPDCRRYFRAFLTYMSQTAFRDSGSHRLQQERKAAAILQKLVTRHFYLSCLECSRSSNQLVRRYFWQVAGGTICVWLPSHMNGRDARTWLTTNVSDPDARRVGESERVQRIVGERLLLPRLFTQGEFDGGTHIAAGWQSSQPRALPEAISIKGLAGAIAEEKAGNVDGLRPSIRALGKSALRALVQRVFDDLASECFELSAVASEFGLSKATLSRFAGTKWSARKGREEASSIPDLWRNTAQTLAGHPEFVEAAKAAGVWPRIESVLAGLQEGGPS